MNEALQHQTVAAFTAALASPAPTPGGGGAAALTGALAAALGAMALRITARRAADAAETETLADRLEAQRAALLALIDADAAAFAPLAAVYALPKDAPDRAQRRAEASEVACAVPLELLRRCCETAELLNAALVHTGKLLWSDVGCGAALCRAALSGAAMNVYVNTPALSGARRAQLEGEATALQTRGAEICDQVEAAVLRRLKGADV